MLFKQQVLFLAAIGLLQNASDAARMDMKKLQLSTNEDTEPAVRVNATLGRNRVCKWGEHRCCCEAPTSEPKAVVCKTFLTGMHDGEEMCKCGDAGATRMGFSNAPHNPTTWRKTVYAVSLAFTGEGQKPFFEEMDRQCSDSAAPVAFETNEPEGSCTDTRLYNFLPPYISSSCASSKLSETKAVRDKLKNSKLLQSFDSRIDGSSLMGCTAISSACGGFKFQDTVVSMLLSNLDTEALGIGPGVQKKLMAYAGDMLKAESGLDQKTADLLLNWAFYHEEDKNPYCVDSAMEGDRDMLVTGLTASDPDSTPYEKPWSFHEERWEKLIYGPFRQQLRMTIEGMFQSDCPKTVAPAVDLESAKAGVGLEVNFKGEGIYSKEALEAQIAQASAEKDFLKAAELQQNLDGLTVGAALEQFAHIPLIGTTLAYIKSPTLQHPIEANEAELVRSFVQTLATLLSDPEFYGHLTRNGGLDEWPMPPEIEGLWSKVRPAQHGERIWPDSVIEELKQPSEAKPRCNCKDIEPDLGVHLLNMLPKIGIDFGNVQLDKETGVLSSDKETETLQHVELEALARTMVTVEAGIEDPLFAVKYIVASMNSAAAASGSSTGVPKISSAGKVKGVLVGMPIIQNLWAMLNKDTMSTEVFAKKMKWFFVANIIWAVWHAIEKNLPPEDIVLGLCTAIMSTLSSFAYDGQWITFSNSKPFTDYMLGVYSVWNYRFVKQWASGEDPRDQWQHVSVALSLPIVEALVNHGDATYYINYRRDDLFHSMLLMLDRQLKEAALPTNRCCCDWDTKPGWESEMKISMRSMKIDHETMKQKQKCNLVPPSITDWKGSCPSVHISQWPPLDEEQQVFMSTWTKNGWLQLHHDPSGCADASKVVFVPETALG